MEREEEVGGCLHIITCSLWHEGDFVLGTVSPPPLASPPSLTLWLSKYYNRKLGRGLGMSFPSSYFFDVSCELTMMMRRGGGEKLRGEYSREKGSHFPHSSCSTFQLC